MASSKATSVEEYLEELPEERRKIVSEVRDFILKHLPDGYRESMNWGMITYEIPLERYPETYNSEPLGYLSLAAQKNYYALYLMCVYQDKELQEFLVEAYKQAGKKLDMGKSCLRFKKVDDLHKEALGKVISSTTPEEFIEIYEQSRNG